MIRTTEQAPAGSGALLVVDHNFGDYSVAGVRRSVRFGRVLEQFRGREERDESIPRLFDPLAAALLPVDDGEDAKDASARPLDDLGGLERAPTARHHVLDDDHLRAFVEAALDAPARTVLLGLFPDGEAVELAARERGGVRIA